MASESGHRPPNRLADYFLSVAWRPDGQNDADQLAPTVTDRFPLVDWADYELSPYAVAHMCMPQGLEVKEGVLPAPEAFHFVMASERGARIYGACMQYWERVSGDQVDSLGDEYATTKCYLPRALCLISHWPFLATFNQVLSELYRTSLSVSPVPMELYIRHLMLEVPHSTPASVPIPSVGSLWLNVERPAINELPLSQVSSELLFHCLDLDSLLQLFTLVLSEARVVLHSSKYALLSAFGEALRDIMFPLHWQVTYAASISLLSSVLQHAYIPVLPQSLQDFTQSPCPYIMGLLSEHLDLSMLPPEVVVVNLDTGLMELTQDNSDPGGFVMPAPLPKKETESLRDQLKESGVPTKGAFTLPADFGMALLHAPPVAAAGEPMQVPTALEDLADWCVQAPSSPKVCPSTPKRSGKSPEAPTGSGKLNSEGIRQSFLQMFVSLLADYRNFISDTFIADEQAGVLHRADSDLAPLFDTVGFISSAPEKSQPFLAWFTTTVAFNRFVEDAARAGRNDWELRYFDSMIESHKSSPGLQFWKKKQVPFLQQTSKHREPSTWSVEHVAQVYSVPPVSLDAVSGSYEYQVFPSLDEGLLGQPLPGDQSAKLMTEIAPLPRRIAPSRKFTGEFDFVLEELVMAKMSLSSVQRKRDILWQDMQVMTAQIEKLDMQKAVLEEQVEDCRPKPKPLEQVLTLTKKFSTIQEYGAPVQEQLGFLRQIVKQSALQMLKRALLQWQNDPIGMSVLEWRINQQRSLQPVQEMIRTDSYSATEQLPERKADKAECVQEYSTTEQLPQRVLSKAELLQGILPSSPASSPPASTKGSPTSRSPRPNLRIQTANETAIAPPSLSRPSVDISAFVQGGSAIAPPSISRPMSSCASPCQSPGDSITGSQAASMRLAIAQAFTKPQTSNDYSPPMSPPYSAGSSMTASQGVSLRTAIRSAFAKNKHIQTTSPLNNLQRVNSAAGPEDFFGTSQPQPVRQRRRSITAECTKYGSETWAATCGPFSTNSTPMASPAVSVDRRGGELLSGMLHSSAALYASNSQKLIRSQTFSNGSGTMLAGTPRSSTSLIRLDSLGQEMSSFKQTELEKKLALLENENEMLRRKLENSQSDTSPVGTDSTSSFNDVISPASSFQSGSLQWNANV